LPHSQEERQDAAATPCEVNDSISRVFAILPKVSIRQRLTVFGRSFFVPQISEFSLFLVDCAHRTPQWPVARTWPSRLVAAASRRIRGKSGIPAAANLSLIRLGGLLLEWLKSNRSPLMRPKLADQVAKNNKNLFEFFIFVGSRLGLRS
jgi:hypothetical protein